MPRLSIDITLRSYYYAVQCDIPPIINSEPRSESFGPRQACSASMATLPQE